MALLSRSIQRDREPRVLFDSRSRELQREKQEVRQKTTRGPEHVSPTLKWPEHKWEVCSIRKRWQMQVPSPHFVYGKRFLNTSRLLREGAFTGRTPGERVGVRRASHLNASFVGRVSKRVCSHVHLSTTHTHTHARMLNTHLHTHSQLQSTHTCVHTHTYTHTHTQSHTNTPHTPV